MQNWHKEKFERSGEGVVQQLPHPERARVNLSCLIDSNSKNLNVIAMKKKSRVITLSISQQKSKEITMS